MVQKKRWRLVHILLAVAFVFTLLPLQPAHAASKKAQAMSAYKKTLSKSTVTVIPSGAKAWKWAYVDSRYGTKSYRYRSSKAGNVRFTTAYIDNDGVPELILWDQSIEAYGIWTYRNGKVVCIHYDSVSSLTGYYKKKSIIKSFSSGSASLDFDHWYKIERAKGRNILTVEHNYRYNNPNTYYIGNSAVSWSKFNKKLKSYVGSTSMTKFTLRANNKSNRNKYLK